MRIVHITFGFGLGGIETMLHNIANEQVKLGHDIHIVVINDIVNKELKTTLDSRIHFHCLKRKVGSKNPFVVFTLNYLLYKIKPDVVHLHYASIAKYIFLKNLRNKLCVTQHDVCKEETSQYLYLVKHIFAISNVVKDDIKRNRGLDSIVVLNGIDPSKIKKSEKSQGNLAGTPNVFRIVQVSRLMHEKKGQHILIAAVNILVNKGYRNISLDFIGDGPSMDYLKGIVKTRNLDKYIHFLGAKDQSFIFSHLCDYDLYVQPSIFEGFGLTVAEGMAAKIPVLVSENEGPLEIIDNGKYGYSFRNQDIADCSSKIEMFLNHKNDSIKIELAYDRVCTLYNVKTTAKRYIELYKQIFNL